MPSLPPSLPPWVPSRLSSSSLLHVGDWTFLFSATESRIDFVALEIFSPRRFHLFSLFLSFLVFLSLSLFYSVCDISFLPFFLVHVFRLRLRLLLFYWSNTGHDGDVLAALPVSLLQVRRYRYKKRIEKRKWEKEKQVKEWLFARRRRRQCVRWLLLIYHWMI